MNKTKRNLILWAGIINLIQMVANFVLTIIVLAYPEVYKEIYAYYLSYISYYSIYMIFVEVIAGIIGSILLFYSIRKGGKYFRTSQKFYVAGLIITIIAGGWLPWILLLISMFIPDIIVMNTPNEVRREERREQNEYDAKKAKVEELRRLKDEGLITEEEFNQKLMELL